MSQVLPDGSRRFFVVDLLPEEIRRDRLAAEANLQNVENDDGNRTDGKPERTGECKGHQAVSGAALRGGSSLAHHAKDNVVEADGGWALHAAETVVAAIIA